MCIIYHVNRSGKRLICAHLVDNYMYMTHVYAWPMGVYIEFIMCICFFKIDFICLGVLPACIFCTSCACTSCGGQKGLSYPVELKLQMLVSHHIGAGNGTWGLWKNIQCS